MAQNVVDADYTGVTSVENLITAGSVTLGTQAQRAGVANVVNNGVDALGASTDLTLNAGYTNDMLSYTSSVSSLDSVVINNAAANTVFRTTFTSAEVGNANINDGSATAPQDGGLAVRLQKEDGADALVGGVSRFDDEGISFGSSDATVRFDVRDISGTQRGTFAQVTLGTAGADALAVNADFAAVGTAGIYINGGAGNDGIAGTANADFLVGGAGDDGIATGGGNDNVLGGAGNDVITDDGGRVNLDGGAGNDTFVMTGQLQAGGLIATRDTITGGDGRDTLEANAVELVGIAIPVVGDAAAITGIEVLRSANAFTGALTTTNVQAGIESVVFANDTAGPTQDINFEAGARSVVVGVSGATDSVLVGGTLLTITAAGTASDDMLTISNGHNAAALGGKAFNAFNDEAVVAQGYETVTINTGTATANGAQSLAVAGGLLINGSTLTTNSNLNIAGVNALTLNAASNSTGVFNINASTLTAQAAGTATLTLNVAASAGAGSASVTGSAGEDIVVLNGRGFVDGGAGADNITGSIGNDTLNGGEGNDSITAGTGNDLIDGGAGNDVVDMAANLGNGDTVAGGEGRDALAIAAVVAAAAQVNVSGFEILRADATLANQDLAQFINNTTFDTLEHNAGAVTVKVTNVGNGFNNAVFTGAVGGDADVTRLVNTETNTFNVSSGIRGVGAKGDNTFSLALANEDTLNVTAGRAVAGNTVTVDTLTAGDLDTVNITGAQNVVIGSTALALNGTARNVTFNAADATGAVVIDGSNAGSANVALILNGSTTGVNILTGNANADTINGGNAADILVGGAGADVINGGSLGDAITGGTGADIINGGADADLYIYTGAADSNITALPANAFDAVTVTTGDTFQFSAAVVAVTGGATGAETPIIGAAPATAAALLASLDTAFKAVDDGVANVEAGLFQYVTGGRQFLVVDLDADGAITATDNIVEIVGTATALTIAGGNVVIG